MHNTLRVYKIVFASRIDREGELEAWIILRLAELRLDRRNESRLWCLFDNNPDRAAYLIELNDGTGRGGRHCCLEGPLAGTIQDCLRSKLFLNGAVSHDHGLSSGTRPHNLEKKLQALDPTSYQNQRKRALEEARGFSQLVSVDCSSSSSDNKNEEEKFLTLQQRKRQFPGGYNGDPRGQYGWFSENQGQSMSYDDFNGLLNRAESVTPSPIDSFRHRENASEPARRMPHSDSQTPARGRLPGSNPRLPLPMGEIVEVEGGHIVRSTGRKDRHSKVYTAKGPRDRRVRLSASTAIQFYDLQDRLGYDRPSKAVAWLIEKAKASIDDLDQLPEITPPVNPPGNANPIDKNQGHDEETEAQSTAAVLIPTTIRADFSRAIARERARERAKGRTQERDAVAKAAVDNTTANNIQAPYFQGNFNLYSNATHSLVQALQLQNSAPPKGFMDGQSSHVFHPMDIRINPSDSISRKLQLQASQLQQQQQAFYQSLSSETTTQALHNFSSQFETPAVVFSKPENSSIGRNHQTQQGLFTDSAYQVSAAAFARDVSISEHHHEFGNDHPPQRILRASPWTNNNNNNSLSTNGLQGDFGPFGSNLGLNIGGNGQYHQNSLLRGTLQSSSSPVRVRPMPLAHDFAAATDHLLHHNTAAAISLPGGGGGFSGFRIPARIQGIDEPNDVKPSAASSTSLM